MNELDERISEIRCNIKKLKEEEELAEFDRKADEWAAKLSRVCYALLDNLIGVGFTREEAFEIVKIHAPKMTKG